MHITDNIQNHGYSLYNSKNICEIDTFLLHTNISHLNEIENEYYNKSIYPNDYYVINNYNDIYKNDDDNNIIENNNHNEYIYFSNIIDIENDEDVYINNINSNSVYQQYIDDITKINDERDDMDIHSDDDNILNDLEPLSDSSYEIHSIISKLISFQ